jgi:hypothetical protein
MTWSDVCQAPHIAGAKSCIASPMRGACRDVLMHRPSIEWPNALLHGPNGCIQPTCLRARPSHRRSGRRLMLDVSSDRRRSGEPSPALSCRPLGSPHSSALAQGR